MLPGVEVLPAGFSLPPLPYLVGIGLGTLIVGVLLAVMQPPVGHWDVLALGTWMAVGATLHALHQIGAFPELFAPLFGAPAVYATTFVVAGMTWLFALVTVEAGMFSSVPRMVGVVGLNVAVVFMAFHAWIGISRGTIAPQWPVLALVAAVAVAALAFVLLSLTYTDAVAVTGKAGAFVVFAHALDAVSTAVGVDIIGVGERSPLPAAIMNAASNLPTPAWLGVGWSFVLVKLLLALVILALFTGYVRERPDRGNLLLALVAAVGFGPGVYNLLLFLVGTA